MTLRDRWRPSDDGPGGSTHFYTPGAGARPAPVSPPLVPCDRFTWNVPTILHETAANSADRRSDSVYRVIVGLDVVPHSAPSLAPQNDARHSRSASRCGALRNLMVCAMSESNAAVLSESVDVPSVVLIERHVRGRDRLLIMCMAKGWRSFSDWAAYRRERTGDVRFRQQSVSKAVLWPRFGDKPTPTSEMILDALAEDLGEPREVIDALIASDQGGSEG